MGEHRLELLAPAKNRELGVAALNHGADAVYIGAHRFGARAAAGNPVKEIEALCAYAHKFNARVYVAMNTILFDDELEQARDLVCQVWDAGADALIIQDMGLVEMDLPPIPLFASTQADIRTPEKVKFLEASGFQRVILARELGLDAIEEIRKQTRVDLEAFVHGALCVCYSGQCYMSAAIGGRSANRGACGQPCRLPWDLATASGRVLAKDRYLLSLKDMDRSDHLGAMAAAGITSFKIEGRLKDLAYVKNITGYYRRRLDALMENGSRFEKASSGRTRFFFTPDPAKTFNRGRTDYFLTDPDAPVHSFDTPKSLGQKIGRVKRTGPDWIQVDRPHDLRNGDGLCFMSGDGRLSGFYINRVDAKGRFFPPGRHPVKKFGLAPGTLIFRNHDQAFEKALSGQTAERKIALNMVFSETESGFKLSARDEDGICAKAALDVPKVPARNPDRALAVIQNQLEKLGNTMFALGGLDIRCAPCFLTARDLNSLRRSLVRQLEGARIAGYCRPRTVPAGAPPFYKKTLDFRANAANRLARRFYRRRGVTTIAPPFELNAPGQDVPVMATKHCILRGLDLCPRKNKQTSTSPSGPFFIENEKGRFKVCFDCNGCGMRINL